MLLEILCEIRAVRGAEWTCEILLRRGGPLQAEFAALGKIHLLSHSLAEGPTVRAGLFRRFFDRPIMHPRRLARVIRQWQPRRFDLIYNNTATNGYLLSKLRSLECPILTHVHELAYAMRHLTSPAALAQTLANTDRFIAASPVVMADLVECGATRDRITVVLNFLTSLPQTSSDEMRKALRRDLDLPADAYVITGCGHLHWLKGPDLFVEVAAALSRLTRRELVFPWIGGVMDRRFAMKVRRLVRNRGLGHTVRFVGEVSDAKPWFAASDCVIVTSRIESFSLVALEAAALGRPVLGFDDARGLLSLLGDAPGLVVPRLDAAAMASRVLGVLQDPEKARECGQRLHRKVAAQFMAEPQIRTILSVTDELTTSWRKR